MDYGIAQVSIHDRFLLAHHFTEELRTQEADPQLAIARDYGMSPTSMRAILKLVRLAPEIQERIGQMNEADALARVPFRKLASISQIKTGGEQRRRFEEMISSAQPKAG